MDFLCVYHRRQLALLPAVQQRELWLSWMEHALCHYQRREPQDALLLSGCAFELAGVSEGLAKGRGLHIELTLAAIFAARVLCGLGNQACAERMIHRALHKLQTDGAPVAPIHWTDSVEQCRQVLVDANRHGDFFLNYLNWPAFWEEQPALSWPAQAYH